MKIIDYHEVSKLLPMNECVELMREALGKLARKESVQYLRTVIRLPEDNILGLMPAYYDGKYFGAKIITIFHKNTGGDLPSHQGSVLLYDSTNGAPLAMVDGDSITRIRTGAVSAVATDLLALKKAETAAFIGAGAQARSHLEALMTVRPIKSAAVYDIQEEYALRFAEEARKKYGIAVRAVKSPSEAAWQADVINTVSPSPLPVLSLKDIKKGAHINAVGASTPTARELASDLAAAGVFWCDNIEAVLAEAGDFLIPKAEGLFDNSHIVGEIGELLIGAKGPGRKSDDDITIFEALGLGVEDVASAKFIYEKTL